MATLTELRRWSMQGLESLPEVAQALGEALPHGGVVAIHGAMGAGKTTLVRQLLASWNVEEEGASPTFGLVHHHAVHREGGVQEQHAARRLHHHPQPPPHAQPHLLVGQYVRQGAPVQVLGYDIELTAVKVG